MLVPEIGPDDHRQSSAWPSVRQCTSARWHHEAMVIKVRGRKHWLWRVVEDEGEVLNFLVQPRRCARSAR